MQNFGWIEGDKRMSEHEMVKVYELAKELGIDSISLLDKLKKLNINVKNHMSDLKAEEVQIARSSLRKPSETEKVGKKAPTKARKKGTTAAEASASAASQGSTADAEKRTASPVLRRRVKTEGGVETTVTQSSVISHRQAAEHTHEEVADHREAPAVYQEEEQQTFVEEQSPVESLDTATSESSDLMETDMGAAGSSQLLEDHQVAVSDQVTPESTSVAEGESAPAVSAEPETPTTTTAQPITPPVKTRPPVVLTPRPVAPRRSILKIVEATAPPPRPIIKPAPAPATTQPKVVKGTTTTQDKDGFRIIKMTKENLDQMVEEEAAKKRGAGREVELRPEDIRFADYRKKELVFLPKKKRIPLGKEIKKTQKTVSKAQKRIVQMQETISVQDLANQLSVKAADVIRKTMALGQMVSIQQHLDFDTATLIAHEYQYEVRNVAFNESSFLANNQEDPEGSLVHRPPVVTIMGHVDHGKTTLLDSIREANVAGGEAGGITQHIGAYTVNKNGKLITFIDTPGHEAFTVMRARGANVTDIVILVVSADDGVMPQTREALSHAQAAKVPVIVAVNKIDKPGANPEKIKQGLAELNLLAEDWGGDTIFVPVSALKKTNLDKLLDAVLLQAEMLDLKANPDVLASGVVLEARVEKGRGAVVSVLVSKGTLKIGDPLVSGNFTGKVKAMVNDKGQTQKITTPGIAVEILGFEGLPNAGDSFNVTADEGTARKIVENRVDKTRAKAMATGNTKVSLEELFSKIQTGTVKELNVILKADAFGSAEAIRDSLVKLSTEKVKVKPILCSPGGITESDVLLGSASSAIILGFNVRPETKARQIAEAEHVEIKCYSIIYELLDDVKKAMTGLLDKKKVERFLGRAEVRQTFVVPKIGTIAGAAVIDGKILRGANVRLLRDSRIIYEGKMSSLRRFKDDAKEVAQGFECGIGIENYNDLKAGDIIEAYQIDLVTPELS